MLLVNVRDADRHQDKLTIECGPHLACNPLRSAPRLDALHHTTPCHAIQLDTLHDTPLHNHVHAFLSTSITDPIAHLTLHCPLCYSTYPNPPTPLHPPYTDTDTHPNVNPYTEPRWYITSQHNSAQQIVDSSCHAMPYIATTLFIMSFS